MLDSVLPQTQTKNIKQLATPLAPVAPPMRVIKDEMATTPLPPSAGKCAKTDPQSAESVSKPHSQVAHMHRLRGQMDARGRPSPSRTRIGPHEPGQIQKSNLQTDPGR
eukprot:6053394-Amphidinium_carterae.1